MTVFAGFDKRIISNGGEGLLLVGLNGDSVALSNYFVDSLSMQTVTQDVCLTADYGRGHFRQVPLHTTVEFTVRSCGSFELLRQEAARKHVQANTLERASVDDLLEALYGKLADRSRAVERVLP
jgi:hypothetical protein